MNRFRSFSLATLFALGAGALTSGAALADPPRVEHHGEAVQRYRAAQGYRGNDRDEHRDRDRDEHRDRDRRDYWRYDRDRDHAYVGPYYDYSYAPPVYGYSGGGNYGYGYGYGSSVPSIVQRGTVVGSYYRNGHEVYLVVVNEGGVRHQLEVRDDGAIIHDDVLPNVPGFGY